MQRERAARGGGAALGPAGSDGEEEGEDGEEGGRGGGAPLRHAIYNVDALHDKLEDIAWSEEQPWEESLALTSPVPTAVANAEDDLERELAFYNQVRARGRPQAAGSATQAARCQRADAAAARPSRPHAQPAVGFCTLCRGQVGGAGVPRCVALGSVALQGRALGATKRPASLNASLATSASRRRSKRRRRRCSGLRLRGWLGSGPRTTTQVRAAARCHDLAVGSFGSQLH